MPEPMSSVFSAKMLLTPTIIAGVCGAVVSLRFATNLRVWERATAVISGAVMAQYFSPLAAYVLGIPNYQQSVGFFIGLFGLSLTAAIYDAIKKADPWGLIMSRWGGK